LIGRDFERVGSSSIVMVHAKEIARLSDVEAYFATLASIGTTAILRRLNCVTHTM